jgi:hypothetical protein
MICSSYGQDDHQRTELMRGAIGGRGEEEQEEETGSTGISGQQA